MSEPFGNESTHQTAGSTPEHGVCSRLRPFGTTIFTTISRLAAEHGAVNLGQGFPDENPPEPLIETVVEAIRSGDNQYAPMPGRPELRQAIANDRARRGHGIWSAEDEVTVTSGATGGLAAALLGTLEAGDEVILFDPAYDAYPALVAMAGGRAVRLAPEAPDFRITHEALESAITPRTRVILVNSPWNPTGRVLDDDELEVIADCCRRHDLLCVSDEVYERMVFTREHRSISTLPGMRDRTLVVSSLGKTYSCTGWKIGWVCAGTALTRAVRAAHQFLVFSVPGPLQQAATRALNDHADDWDRELTASYLARRDLLVDGLEAAGLIPLTPDGTYFVLAEISGLGDRDDRAFCDRMLRSVGVAAIPASVFTEHGRGLSTFVRFAFCKPEPMLERAVANLREMEPLREGQTP